MGKRFPAMLPEHEAFIRKQHVFFVGSAPMAEDGHINISPKGYDSLRILSPTEVAYLDLTGSGNETSTHLAENGRITLMFVALEGPPMILRLYGTGRSFAGFAGMGASCLTLRASSWSQTNHRGSDSLGSVFMRVQHPVPYLCRRAGYVREMGYS